MEKQDWEVNKDVLVHVDLFELCDDEKVNDDDNDEEEE